MRIAQIAPIIERVPPRKYGGTERVVFELTEELVRRKHDVTLFASGDSITSARLISVYPKSLRDAKIRDLYGSNILSMMNIGMAYTMGREFDIIHDHCGYLSLPPANICLTPVVMTYHGQFTPEVRRVYQNLKRPYVVSISKAQVEGIKDMHIIGNVYNGLSMEQYPFSEEHDNYLLYVGRISVEKGVHYAIETALNLNIPLIIAAKLDEVDLPYFDQYVGPYLSESIKWVGEVDEKERNRLMCRAKCFLHPVAFKEPFGLTLIESMACGCPVVAFNKGSIPEVIAEGKSGFVVSDVNEMIEAVKIVHTLSRRECRDFALKNFNAQRMADGYEKIYNEILEGKYKKEHEQEVRVEEEDKSPFWQL